MECLQIQSELRAIIGNIDTALNEIRTAIPKDRVRDIRELICILHDKILEGE